MVCRDSLSIKRISVTSIIRRTYFKRSIHVYVHVRFVFRIPDFVTFEEAALVEPLAVGVRAASRAGVTAGSSVLVSGAGAIGLTSLLASLARGATTVCITG